MPWIQNVALSDIRKGFHINAGANSMLIQICDPPGDFPTPLHMFKEVHQFHRLPRCGKHRHGNAQQHSCDFRVRVVAIAQARWLAFGCNAWLRLGIRPWLQCLKTEIGELL